MCSSCVEMQALDSKLCTMKLKEENETNAGDRDMKEAGCEVSNTLAASSNETNPSQAKDIN